jgi:hypothetical protein
MRLASLALLPLVGGLTGAALGLMTPDTAVAEKLPVDCSGRYTDCFERKLCTRYNAEHNCTERTTEIWHWYATAPLKP